MAPFSLFGGGGGGLMNGNLYYTSFHVKLVVLFFNVREWWNVVVYLQWVAMLYQQQLYANILCYNAIFKRKVKSLADK